MRPRDGLAEPLVVERRLARVQHEVEGEVRPAGRGLDVARPLQLGDALGRHRLDPVEAPGLQPGEPHRVVGRRVEDDLVEVRAARPEVLVPALERDVVVLHPLHELVRARCRSGKSLGSFSLSAFSFTISVACDSMASSGPNGLAQVEAHLVRPDRLHALDRREEDAHGQLVLGVEQAGEGEDDVLGRERLAVVEDGVVDQVEEPGLVVLLLPGLREAGDELARLVHVDELVVDVLVDLERRVELGEARVHVHRLVDGGDAEGAAALGLALRARRTRREAAAERGRRRRPRRRAAPATAAA